MATSTSLMPSGNSVKRDAGHLDTLYNCSNNNRQVLSPNPEGNQLGRTTQRSLTPRTRRSVHRGREDRDDRVMALEGEIETLSLELTSSFNVQQEQLDVLNQDQRQQREGMSRAIAQRTKLRMSTDGNEEMNLRRQRRLSSRTSLWLSRPSVCIAGLKRAGNITLSFRSE
eukprot:2248712-Amphidinium_carterae.2